MALTQEQIVDTFDVLLPDEIIVWRPLLKEQYPPVLWPAIDRHNRLRGGKPVKFKNAKRRRDFVLMPDRKNEVGQMTIYRAFYRSRVLRNLQRVSSYNDRDVLPDGWTVGERQHLEQLEPQFQASFKRLCEKRAYHRRRGSYFKRKFANVDQGQAGPYAGGLEPSSRPAGAHQGADEGGGGTGGGDQGAGDRSS